VADYGVNIAVAVKNSQAVTQLSNKIKETGLKVNQLNNLIENFADITGTTVVNSVKNFNKALSDASSNLNNAALGTKAATEAARNYVKAQNEANAALKEQQNLLRAARLAGETVSKKPFGPMPFGQNPGDVPTKGRPAFDPAVGRQQAIARMVMLETAADVKVADAKRNSILELGQIELDLDRKIRNREIDNIIEQIKLESKLQDDLFRSAIQKSEKRAQTFMEDLGFRKGAELKAIAEVDKARKKAASEAIRLTGQTSPIGGAVGIPGSPAALRAAAQAQRLRSASSSALIGGAFPLLFGQGLGAAAGGAAGGFGGGMIGGEFGFGLSLAGTQVGSMVDQLAKKAIDLGRALDPLTADTEAVLSAVGKADTKFALLVKELEAAGRGAEALQLVTEELEKVVGENGVEAIELFSAGIRGLQNDFTVFITQVAAVVADAINTLMGQTKQAQEIRKVGETVSKARESNDPRIKAAIAELDAIPEFAFDKETQQRRVNTRRKIADLVEKTAADELKAKRDSIVTSAAKEKELTTLIQSDKVAREARYLLAAQIKLQEAGNNLLDERVVAARKNVIQEEYLLAYRQAEGSEQKQLLAEDQKRLDLIRLGNQIAAAQTAETKRLARETQKTTEETKKTTEERNTQITQALTLEQKFAAELKQRKATTQLEADKARIAAQFEDRMRRIEKIGDDTLTKEAERLANQIKITDEVLAEANARERSLRAVNSLKDSQAGFEMQLETLRANAPGQFDGAFGGSQRTAFLGELEMRFELQKRNREIELMRGKAAAGTAEQSEVENLIEARDQYKLYQEQILEATVAQQQFAEALAVTRPVTDSLFDGLMAVAEGTKTAEQAFADFLRSIASMLMDAAKQMIAQYIAIGVARMFAGVPGFGSPGNFEQNLGFGGFSSPSPTAGIDFESIFGRANGGAVGAGRPYLVGERGPELFVPGAQGNIVPNNAMGSANVTVNVDASGSSVEGNAEQASQLGKAIGVAVQQELIKQKRPGGLLAV